MPHPICFRVSPSALTLAKTAQKVADIVTGFTKAEIQDFFRKNIHASSTQRAKLVVQLFAQRGAQPDAANDVAGSQATAIEDVRAFKAGLVASAGPRPVKSIGEYEDIGKSV